MKRFIIGLVLGVLMGTFITAAIAKYESSSADAGSEVGYGKVAVTGVLIPFLVDADGTLHIN